MHLLSGHRALSPDLAASITAPLYLRTPTLADGDISEMLED